MNRIYKYRLISNVTLMPLPEGATVVHVGNQDNHVTIWVRLDPNQRLEERTFMFVGTGQPFPEDAIYLGTAHVGPFVWHVLEQK